MYLSSRHSERGGEHHSSDSNSNSIFTCLYRINDHADNPSSCRCYLCMDRPFSLHICSAESDPSWCYRGNGRYV